MIENNQNISDEISMKELLLGVRYYWKLLIRKWYIIIPIALLVSFAWSYKSIMSRPNYNASLTFMVNEDEASSIGTSGMSSVLGRFGISSGKYNLEKILALSKSKKILQRALLEKVKIENKEDFIANHLIRMYGLNSKEEDSTYFTQPDPNKFSPNQNKMLSKLHNLLTGDDGVYSTSIAEKSGIMSQTLSTHNDTLSVELLNQIFYNLSTFYISKSIEREKTSYNIIKTKADSLYKAINKLGYSKASFDDKTLGVWQDAVKESGNRMDRDSRINMLVYGEVLKNLEISDYTLKSKMPFIQIIDSPVIPLKMERRGVVKHLIMGFILGFFICSLIIILHHYIQQVLNE